MTATENRLREALSAAAVTAVDVRPLTVPARRRSRVPLRVTAVALAVAATAFGVVRLAAPSPASPMSQGETIVAMSMGGEAPGERAEVSVFFCKENNPFPNCKGGKTTETEKENLVRMLEARPEVKSVTFEDRQTAWENFRQQNQDNPGLINVVVSEDMSESFRVRTREGADSLAVARAAHELPGVSNVIDLPCLLERASLWGTIKSKLPWSDDEDQCSFMGKGR
ncbi:permease-like cell division protein FtsX [Streptosporangium sp. NBC_01756]|uniref:permease-like cell division protein FtsX n=1 Tax=Streptosporangium sp. NBC_01756 TaxID=2975950 RepID=UPI002DDC80BD|nr:permease-like cell division protein FtsX [Streptosporangium sp. NBC_01756]WSC90050.1 permease-like cell division protein FtsX [Streptosporangium sp. NBC_01756]